MLESMYNGTVLVKEIKHLCSCLHIYFLVLCCCVVVGVRDQRRRRSLTQHWFILLWSSLCKSGTWLSSSWRDAHKHYCHSQNSTQRVYTTCSHWQISGEISEIVWYNFLVTFPPSHWRFRLGVELMVDFPTSVTWPKQVASIFLFGSTDFISSVQKCLPLIGQIEYKVK